MYRLAFRGAGASEVEGDVRLGSGDNTLRLSSLDRDSQTATAARVGGIVRSGSGNDTVSLEYGGRIEGSDSSGVGVSLGGGDDLLSLIGGDRGTEARILGDVDLGGGDDTLSIVQLDGSVGFGRIDGVVYGGAGSDSFVLDGGGQVGGIDAGDGDNVIRLRARPSDARGSGAVRSLRGADGSANPIGVSWDRVTGSAIPEVQGDVVAGADDDTFILGERGLDFNADGTVDTILGTDANGSFLIDSSGDGTADLTITDSNGDGNR